MRSEGSAACNCPGLRLGTNRPAQFRERSGERAPIRPPSKPVGLVLEPAVYPALQRVAQLERLTTELL